MHYCGLWTDNSVVFADEMMERKEEQSAGRRGGAHWGVESLEVCLIENSVRRTTRAGSWK
jgi:hypothetical protein